MEKEKKHYFQYDLKIDEENFRQKNVEDKTDDDMGRVVGDNRQKNDVDDLNIINKI